MKTIHANNTYQKKHISFFFFMMLLLLIIYGKASAQEQQTTSTLSSHLRIGLGYGLPSGSQMMNSTSSNSSTSSTSKGVYGTLGTGMVLNAAFTHMYSKNIGLDLNLQYLMGKEYKGSNTSTYGGTTYTSNSSIQAHGVMLSPSVIFSAGEKVKPYVQVGFVMGIINVKQEYGSSTYQANYEAKGGLSFGFRGGFGIDVPLSEKISFFSELTFTSMSYYPKKATVVTIADGTTREQNIEFVKEETSSMSGNSSQELKDSFPMGNIALSVGLKFRLNSKNKA
jgi:outer membrane protein W